MYTSGWVTLPSGARYRAFTIDDCLCVGGKVEIEIDGDISIEDIKPLAKVFDCKVVRNTEGE